MKIKIVLKGGTGSGNFSHAGRPGQVGGSAPSSSIPDGKYITDNPGKDYTDSHPNSITAYFKGLYVNPQQLLALRIPGKRGEHLNIDKPRLDELVASMRKEGYRKSEIPLICVEQDGSAAVWEGNHRIRAAVLAGIEAIPLDVRYFGGGELVDGMLTPRMVRIISENFIDSE